MFFLKLLNVDFSVLELHIFSYSKIKKESITLYLRLNFYLKKRQKSSKFSIFLFFFV